MKALPIDVVPGTSPPKFTWVQVVEDLSGERKRIENVGLMPPSTEKAIVELVAMAKALMKENAELKRQLIEKQSDSSKKKG